MKVTHCRSCAGSALREVLALGDTPIANALVPPEGEPTQVPTYPLGISFCEDCSLVQLSFALPAEAIFDDDYPYFSSFSDALCRHAAEHVDSLIQSRSLGARHFAVEVASNDGYLLRNFAAAGVRCLGVDPSPGPARAAEAIGVPTIVDFFGVAAAERIVAEQGRADVIIANNVMAHVPDLNDFIGGFAVLLNDGGVLTVENPSVHEMVTNVEFDTIYHEHYCYFSSIAVDALMSRHGLCLNDVQFFPGLHGGTLRWIIEWKPNRSARCEEQLARERAEGMDAFDFYADFAARTRLAQDSLRSMLGELRASGRTVAAYGAAAKGATLLNSTGIGTDLVAYVVDRNTHKQNKSMPGCGLPILPVEVLRDDQPDYVLLLAWNFADEIMQQQGAYAQAGGRFIVPVPQARVI